MKNYKELWINALRSGNFKQIKGQLRTADGYCCLGVLCEVLAREKVIPKVVKDEWGTYYYDGQDTELPYTVSVLLNITEELEHTLMDLNDDKGFTFSQIADTIEKNLK